MIFMISIFTETSPNQKPNTHEIIDTINDDDFNPILKNNVL
jgi:hypothetical protein